MGDPTAIALTPWPCSSATHAPLHSQQLRAAHGGGFGGVTIKTCFTGSPQGLPWLALLPLPPALPAARTALAANPWDGC